MYMLTVASSQPMDNKASLKGAWLCHVTRFKFWGPIHISGMSEARALKFCTKGDYMKSCHRDDKSPLKGACFAHVTHFCMHNCGLGKNSPRHSIN